VAHNKKLINPSGLPVPKGFNHGVLVTAGWTLFLAGQDASDSQGKIVAVGDVVGQYEQVLRNLKAVVEAADGHMDDIVKLNIFVKDRRDYLAKRKEIGEVHRRYFGDWYPAMALFEVTGFYQEDALIELEGVAIIRAETDHP